MQYEAEDHLIRTKLISVWQVYNLISHIEAEISRENTIIKANEHYTTESSKTKITLC